MGAVTSRVRSKTKWARGKSLSTSPPVAAHSVPGDVAGSADIVLHSHVQEEARHRSAEYDEILAWLDWEFRKSDVNKDGSLEYHEFVRFVKSLNLNLSPRETFQFFALADIDNDERIVWSEIEQDVPRILAKIYASEGPPGPLDWCTMVLPKDTPATATGAEAAATAVEEVVYFNKRTSEVRRDRPPEMDAPGAGLLAPPASPAAAEAVLENTQTFDGLLTWLDWEFHKADLDKNGTLSRDEMATFFHGLHLGLGPQEVQRFCRLADLNNDGAVEWTEILELTPLILQKLMSAIAPGPHDYCLILDAEQRPHYLNKRTGAITTKPPPGFVASQEQDQEQEQEQLVAVASPSSNIGTVGASSTAAPSPSQRHNSTSSAEGATTAGGGEAEGSATAEWVGCQPKTV